MNKKATYLLIRAITYPLQWLPFSAIHWLGRKMGLLLYYAMSEYRKRTLSNLSLAQGLISSDQHLFQIAKESFQNLAINCLEYPKFAGANDLSGAIRCDNPQIAQKLHEDGTGIIFFCGHQSNWEALFLDGTSRMRGMAIGRPIKNKYLYRWIVSVRQKFGGKIVEPRHALREGLWALRKGVFLGIVGDQGKPDSGYALPFFGRRAWTSTAAAFLSYRTNSPIIFAETKRVRGGYCIHYSDPLWPDRARPMEEEVETIMKRLSSLLEESIRRTPGEWLWQHKRWKQPNRHNIRPEFSHDCVCIILPPHPQPLLPHLPILKKIYEFDFLIVMAPENLKEERLLEADELIYYGDPKEILRKDYRFKIVFNFTDFPEVEMHYKKLSALKVLNLATLQRKAKPHLPLSLHDNLSEVFKRALCRPGTLWQPHEN